MGARPGGAGEAPDILDLCLLGPPITISQRKSSFSEEKRGIEVFGQPVLWPGGATSIQSCLVRVKPGLRPWRPGLLRQTVGQSIRTL